MSITIRTRYLPATDTRGSRIRATSALRQQTEALDYSLNPEQNHRAIAARSLRVEESALEMRRETATGYVYAVACSVPSTGGNHSTDMFIIHSGGSYGVPMCGYHEAVQRAQAVRS